MAIRPIAAATAPRPAASRAPAARRRAGERERPQRAGLGPTSDVLAPARASHASDPHGLEREHAVGERDERGAVGDEHGRAARRAASRRPRAPPRSVSPSRLAVGSSSSSSGASRRNARASAMRWRSPAESPAPRSPSTVSSPRGSRRRSRRDRPRRRPPRPPSRGLRAPEAHVLRRSSRRTGAVAAGPTRAAPARRRGRARRARRRRCAPTRLRALTSPSSTPSSVDLPHPLGPTSASTSPGSTVSETRRAPRSRATRVGDAQPVDAIAAARVGHARRGARAASRGRSSTREHLLGGGHALGARVVVGAELAQRQVGLRGQHEREQRGAQSRGSPPISRSPIATATSATEIVATSSRISEERNVIRSVVSAVAPVAVGDLPDRRDLGLRAPEHLQRRQSRDDVQEVAGETFQRAELAVHALPRGRPDERHEQRDQRDRQRDDRAPRSSRCQRTAAITASGTITARQQLRQVQREVAVERVDPACREDRELAVRCSRGCPGRASAMRSSSAARSCDLARAEDRLAASSATHAIDARASTTASSTSQRSAQLCELRPPRRRRDDVREQPRLRDDQQRAENAERYRDEQERAGRARVTEQSLVERPHGAIMTESPCPPNMGIRVTAGLSSIVPMVLAALMSTACGARPRRHG